jgi:hypothetical protein
LAVVPFELLYPPTLAETAFARGLHQPEYFLLKEILGLRLLRIRFRVVQNCGAGGRVSIGTTSPAVVY